MRQIQLNSFFSCVFRIAIVYLLFFVARIAFFVYNKNLFPDVSATEFGSILLGGLKFDTAAMIYLNCVYIALALLPFKFTYSSVYQKVIKWIFIVANSVGVLANCADIAYYDFTLKRTTSLIFQQFANEENMFLLSLQFIWQWWYLSLLFVGMIALMVFLYNRISPEQPQWKPAKFYTIHSSLLILAVVLCIGGVRGGFKHSTRPISLADAGEFVSNPNHMAIVQNTPFAVLRTIGKTGLTEKQYFTAEECEQFYSPKHAGSFSEMQKLNVVVIILESWSREYVGYLNRHIPNYAGFTPFIDSLLQHSYTFKYAYANGRKSIDAIPSVVAGIPYIKVPYVLSHYSSNRTCSLAELLGNEDYYSAFFHGAPNGSMGFQAFTNLVGFNDYFGKDEYANDRDFDGIWGIWDEEFLQFFAKKMDTFREPFFTTVFTLSSHHPFKVPERYEGVFPKGKLPVQECIGYTDNALRQFFRTAQTMDWYNHTLFVITADHASVADLPEYCNSAGGFAIPIAFYRPDNSLQKFDTTTIAQQIDILPSVLNYLKYPHDFTAFGNNVFDTTTTHKAIHFTNENFQCFYKDFVLQFSDKTDKSVNLYNFKNDRLFQHNLLDQNVSEQIEMENYSKAFIQNVTHRIITNTMCE